MKIFLGLNLADELKNKIHSIYKNIDTIGWEKRYNLHITLKYIGEVSSEMLILIQERMNALKFDPFSLSFHSVKYFNHPGKKIILWVAPEESRELHALYQAIEEELQKLNIKKEPGSYHPHITIFKSKKFTLNDVRGFIDQNSEFKTESFLFDSFHVFESKRGGDGMEYKIIHSFHVD